MSFLDQLRAARGLPPKAAREKPLAPPPEQQVFMPEGIDFSQLWVDPQQESGGIGTIMSIVNTVLLVIVLIMSFVK